MTSGVVLLILLLVVAGGVLLAVNNSRGRTRRELADAQAEARRWVERLGGQVLNLVGSNEASKQALADASERYTAAGSQMEQARSTRQYELATQTAMEGLYYVRAARSAMGIDPGPELPSTPGRQRAGAVSEDRTIDLDGRSYAASGNPSDRTPYYYPGGMVAGRPVPQGWYSEPWWKPALVAGAWGVGSFLLFDALFSGMHGVPSTEAFEQGYAEGYQDAADSSGDGGDGGDGGGDYGDQGGADYSGDYGGGDYSSGGDYGDFGGGDFGGDFGGGDFGGMGDF